MNGYEYRPYSPDEKSARVEYRDGSGSNNRSWTIYGGGRNRTTGGTGGASGTPGGRQERLDRQSQAAEDKTLWTPNREGPTNMAWGDQLKSLGTLEILSAKPNPPAGSGIPQEQWDEAFRKGVKNETLKLLMGRYGITRGR
jgi:hypothetical protein